MTRMNRLKRLARSIQQEERIPYMVALRKAREIIEREGGADETQDEEG